MPSIDKYVFRWKSSVEKKNERVKRGNKSSIVVIEGKMREVAGESAKTRYFEVRIDPNKSKYIQVLYDEEKDTYYVNKKDFDTYQEQIVSRKYLIRDKIKRKKNKKNKKKYVSIHSLMQSSIPGKGQIKSYIHNTDGMHI